MTKTTNSKVTYDFLSVENRKMVRRIDRFIARIPGNPTFTKLSGMLRVLDEDQRPSDDFLKAYLVWNKTN